MPVYEFHTGSGKTEYHSACGITAYPFLEKHYNTKLFRYEGKRLELTEAGEILKNDVIDDDA